MTPAERVERLVRSGSVDAEEGKRLLAALHAEPAPSPLRLLLNPFERIGGGLAAGVGLAISIASILFARSGVRFDGMIDAHFRGAPVPTLVALADQLAAWPLAALVFFAYARVFSRHVRLLDFLGMTGFARLPILLMAIPMRAIMSGFDPRDPMHLPPGFLAVALVSLVFVALNINLLYQGFKNASGLSGPKLVWGFIGLFVAAETASKLALAIVT